MPYKMSTLAPLINAICIMFVLVVITVFRITDAAERQQKWERVESFIDRYEEMHSCHDKKERSTVDE